MLTADDILQILSGNMKELESYGVEGIGLFGSFIRNTQNENSDIDFLVRFKKGEKTFDHYMELKFYLENLFDREVDLVTEESVKPELKPYILGSVKYAKGA